MINISYKISKSSFTTIPRLSLNSSVLSTSRSVHILSRNYCSVSPNNDEKTRKKPVKVSINNPSGPVQSSRFPGFDPVFVSPHIKHIRVACR